MIGRSLWQYRLKIEASDFLELSTRDRSHHGNSAMSRNDANKTRWQTFFWEAQCKASSSHRKLSWSVGTFWLESGIEFFMKSKEQRGIFMGQDPRLAPTPPHRLPGKWSSKVGFVSSQYLKRFHMTTNNISKWSVFRKTVESEIKNDVKT